MKVTHLTLIAPSILTLQQPSLITLVLTPDLMLLPQLILTKSATSALHPTTTMSPIIHLDSDLILLLSLPDTHPLKTKLLATQILFNHLDILATFLLEQGYHIIAQCSIDLCLISQLLLIMLFQTKRQWWVLINLLILIVCLQIIRS